MHVILQDDSLLPSCGRDVIVRYMGQVSLEITLLLTLHVYSARGLREGKILNLLAFSRCCHGLPGIMSLILQTILVPFRTEC
jgi:hypothetical protein